MPVVIGQVKVWGSVREIGDDGKLKLTWEKLEGETGLDSVMKQEVSIPPSNIARCGQFQVKQTRT